MTITFIDERLPERLHGLMLKHFGGSVGLRDAALLESALNRARTKADYGTMDICALAACYLFGLTRNCAFVEGNRRLALVVTATFLALNGCELTAGDAESYALMMMLAAGEIDEDGATRFLRDFTVSL